MKECICSSCANLKGMIDENGAISEYECDFGYPDDSCINCEVEGCNLTCLNYISDEESIVSNTTYCSNCNKELTQHSSDSGEGEIYCFDCYLNKNKE